MNYTKQAKYLISQGISVVPLSEDGSKLPKIKWKEYQSSFMSDKDVEKYCSNCGGLAAITGEVSKLMCFDFDLDKQLSNQDFWGDFMKEVPKELKKKMLVNQTRSGGYHIWGRVNFTDKSRKMAHRLLSIPEICEKYEVAKNTENVDLEKFTRILLNKPKSCVIETRFEGSYGVITHKDYKRIYGKTINQFSKEEIELLYTIAYSLDCDFKKRVVYTGLDEDYKTIAKYNNDITADEVADIMIETGLYEYYKDEGNVIKLKRVGSNNPYSCTIFKDTANIHHFGMSNIFEDAKETHTPFELYCSVHNLTEEEAIKNILKKND